jgi:Arc/MetJ family transcription regulator
MRTNIVLDDELLAEAMRLSGSRSKRGAVEEALRTYVAVKSRDEQRERYRRGLERLEKRLAGLKLRQPPSAILRADRDRR